MRHAGLVRSRTAFSLTTVALCGFVGVVWALQALAQTQSSVPSATSRRTTLPTAPPLPASEGKTSAHSEAKPEPKNADLYFVDWTTNTRTDITKGYQFVYKEDDATITGDHGVWNNKKDKQTLDADGHLVFDDKTHHATADRAHVDDLTKTADFEGNVILILKPSSSGTAGVTDAGKTDAGKEESRDSLKSHGATVTCDKLRDQYAEDKKLMKMSGHVVFKQSYTNANGEPVERVLTAEHAEYDGKTETMVLFPPIVGHNNKGETFNQDKDNMIIGTKEGEETLAGHNAHFVFHPSQHQSTDSGPSASGAGQGGAGSGGQKDVKTGSKPDVDAGDKPAPGDSGKSSTSGNANPPPSNSTGGG